MEATIKQNENHTQHSRKYEETPAATITTARYAIDIYYCNNNECRRLPSTMDDDDDDDDADM